jgi:hypothetical protein
MKVNNLTTVIFIWLFSFLIGCSMFENKPSENDIKKTVAENLPGFMEVSKIKIQAMENMGSKVEPNYHSRFIAKINLLKPTYEKVGHLGGNVDSDVVRLVLAENITFEAFGKAVSVLDREKWKTKVTTFDFSIKNRGNILGKFTRPVIEGTDEHEAAKQKLLEWEQAKVERIKKISEGLDGKWVGTYICGQGITGLTLTLSTASTGISATFEFYPTPKNPNIPSGTFSLAGQFTEDGSFSLEPKSWIIRPKGYGMVGLVGNINNNLNEITGNISKIRTCKTFQLTKK